MRPSRVREWAGSFIDVIKIKENFAGQKIITIPMPKLRFSRGPWIGHRVPDVIVAELRVHSHVCVGDPYDLFMKREVGENGFGINKWLFSEQSENERLFPDGIRIAGSGPSSSDF